MTKTFHINYQLLSDFITNGYFPNEGIEQEPSTTKYLANSVKVMVITGIFIFFIIYSFI